MTNPLLFNWEAPISLGAHNFSKWPDDIFINEMQDFVNNLSNSTETPIELASLSVLSVIATAAQGKYLIKIKDDYFEPVNIWTVVALPPGSRKSAVLKELTEPLLTWERERQIEVKPTIDKIISENKTIEARLKEKRRKAGLMDEEGFEEAQEEISCLESKIKEEPSIPQIWTADVTPENLGVIMYNNDEKMSVISDEAGIFDILAGRYSGGIPNIDVFLQGHSGSSLRVNRGSRPPVFLEKATLTFGLVPQPEVLKGITNNKTFRGRGLIGRFLYAYPPSNLGYRTLDTKPVPLETKNAYQKKIRAILDQKVIDKKPNIINLSKEAYETWHLYALATEVKMGEDGPYTNIKDWAGKLPGAIARIAGLLHIVRHAEYAPQAVDISKEDMNFAIKLGSLLSEHALAVFDFMGLDNSIEGAKKILKWIKNNSYEQFTFRDCHYAHKSLFKRAKDLEPSIEILQERYFIKAVETEKKAFRPSRIFKVNPMLYNELKEN
jgi:hypothetical protein